MSARWIEGLEVAAVDRSPMRVNSLDPQDRRSITVHVAGPTALLIAKTFKIHDRVADVHARPDRLTNKDAGDVLRIMMTTLPSQVADTLAYLRDDPRVSVVAAKGTDLLRDLFGGANARGVDMAVEALRGDVSEQRVRALARAFVTRL